MRNLLPALAIFMLIISVGAIGAAIKKAESNRIELLQLQESAKELKRQEQIQALSLQESEDAKQEIEREFQIYIESAGSGDSVRMREALDQAVDAANRLQPEADNKRPLRP